MGKICYPGAKCDVELAKRLGISTERIKHFKGIYATKIKTTEGDNAVVAFDELLASANEGNQESLDKVEKILSETLSESRKRNTLEAKLVGTNYAFDFIELKDIPIEIREAFISLLSRSFSMMVSRKLSNPNNNPNNLSRKEYCHVHEAEIWNDVYKNLFGPKGLPVIIKRKESERPEGVAKDPKLDKEIEALNKLQSLWRPFITFARIELKFSEGLKLGKSTKYDEVDELSDEQLIDSLIDDAIDPEMQTKEGWQELKDRISAFSKLGERTRAIVSQVPMVDVDGKVVKDYFGTTKFEHPAKTHSVLIRLANGAVNSKQMVYNLLNRGGKKHKVLRDHLEKIFTNLDKKTVKQITTDLFVDLKRSKQEYISIGTQIKDSVAKIVRIILNRAKYTIANKYFSDQFESNNIINSNDLTTLEESLSDMDGLLKDKTNRHTISKQIRLALSSLKLYSDDKASTYGETVEDLVENLLDRWVEGDIIAFNNLKLIIDNLKVINDHLKTVKNDGQKDLFTSNLVRRKDDKDSEFKIHMNNIFAILDIYAEENLLSQAKYKQKDGTTATYSSFVTPSFMTDFIDTIKSFVELNDKAGLAKFLEANYLNNPVFAEEVDHKQVIYNPWIRDFYTWAKSEDKDAVKPNLANLFDYGKVLGKPGLEFESMDDEEHLKTLLFEYASGLSLPGHNGEYTNYSVFIMGDANALKTIRGKRYNTLTIPGMNQIYHEFYNVFRSELNRMENTVEMQKTLQEEFDKNFNDKKDSDIAQELRWSIPKSLDKNKDTMFFFYKAFEGKTVSQLKNLTKDEILDAIKEALNKEFEEFLKSVANYKLGDFVKLVQGNNETNITIEKALKDFWLNHKLATISQLQLFTISTAFYKDTKELQKRYKEVHASGTALDIYAVDPTTGEPLFNDPANAIEKCIYFKDIVVNPEEVHPEFMEVILRTFAKKDKKDEVETLITEGIITPKENTEEETKRKNKLKELLGENYRIYNAYTEASLTDGQGYRTLDSYRKICIMGGSAKWTPDMESAYQEIMRIREDHKKTHGEEYKNENLTPEQIARIEQLGAVFQPLKPYMFGHEKIGNGTMPIPVQHKYAEIVLIPELQPAGSLLRDTAYYLEEHNIDLACSDACVKVGAFGQTDISDLSKFGKSTDRENLTEALGYAYIHKFPYEKYRIQTNVPVHNNSENQLFGTQPRKLLLSNIRPEAKMQGYTGFDSFNLWGEIIQGTGDNYSGNQIIALYNALVCANIWESFEEYTEAISDINKLSEILSDNVVGNQRVLIDRLMAYSLTGDDKFLVPLNDVSTSSDAQALIFSLFRKLVNKQKTKGGSLVQASALGLKDYDRVGDLRVVTDGDNILYEECEVPFMLNYTDSKGHVHELKFEDWCNPDGSLKLGKKLEEGTEEWKKYQSYTDKNGIVRKPKIEDAFPGILSIVAYRIPTERGYSMLNLKIKRFSPATGGGIIKVPLEGTIKSGFDFDIKLIGVTKLC